MVDSSRARTAKYRQRLAGIGEPLCSTVAMAGLAALIEARRNGGAEGKLAADLLERAKFNLCADPGYTEKGVDAVVERHASKLR